MINTKLTKENTNLSLIGYGNLKHTIKSFFKQVGKLDRDNNPIYRDTLYLTDKGVLCFYHSSGILFINVPITVPLEHNYKFILKDVKKDFLGMELPLEKGTIVSDTRVDVEDLASKVVEKGIDLQGAFIYKKELVEKEGIVRKTTTYTYLLDYVHKLDIRVDFVGSEEEYKQHIKNILADPGKTYDKLQLKRV